MPRHRTRKRLPLLWALVGPLAMLTFGALVGMWSAIATAHASQHVLACSVSAAAPAASSSAARVQPQHELLAATVSVRPQAVEAPAVIQSAPVGSHSETPSPGEVTELSEGGGQADDDELSDRDEPVDTLRALLDGDAQLHWEVQADASLVGRVVSRLDDDRGDKPPRA